jgi:hypothetical protein
MWSAFQNDLTDFVTQLKDDTNKTVNKVLGDVNEEDEDELTLQIFNKKITDARRSFNTYNTEIDEQYLKEYEKYFKTFSLASFASDIATILDEEPDISRYYAELVPTEIKPEIFWSRLFFRVMVLCRGGMANLDDDDDDEELIWENDKNDIIINKDKEENNTILSHSNNDNFNKIQKLNAENLSLKTQVKTLLGRINELEQIINNNNNNQDKDKNDINKQEINQDIVEASIVDNNSNSNNDNIDDKQSDNYDIKSLKSSTSSFENIPSADDHSSDDSALINNNNIKFESKDSLLSSEDNNLPSKTNNNNNNTVFLSLSDDDEEVDWA